MSVHTQLSNFTSSCPVPLTSQMEVLRAPDAATPAHGRLLQSPRRQKTRLSWTLRRRQPLRNETCKIGINITII